MKAFLQSKYVSDAVHVLVWILAFTVHVFPQAGQLTIAGILSLLTAYAANSTPVTTSK